MELKPRVFRVEFHYRLLCQFEASLVFHGRKRRMLYSVCPVTTPHHRALFAETCACLSSNVQVNRDRYKVYSSALRTGCEFLQLHEAVAGGGSDRRRKLRSVRTVALLCSLMGAHGIGMRGDKNGVEMQRGRRRV